MPSGYCNACDQLTPITRSFDPIKRGDPIPDPTKRRREIWTLDLHSMPDGKLCPGSGRRV